MHDSSAPEPETRRHRWFVAPAAILVRLLLATVLGIRPAEPGFRSVQIRPALGDLERAEGVMPHEKGLIEVQLHRTSAGGIRAHITLPAGLTGSFEWEGKQTLHHGGAQEISY